MKPSSSSPRQAAADAKRAVKRLARPPGDFDARRYFRGELDLGFYNVRAKEVRDLARSIHVAQAGWRVDDAVEFADLLIRDRFLEVKSLGIEVLARYRRHFEPRHLAIWKRWLADGYSANWATTDSICGYLIGPLVASRPELARRMERWSRHRVMWVRRASAVGLLRGIRSGAVPLDLLYKTAATLHADREDLIEKAVGWALREAGRVDPPRLERYLRERGLVIPRTTLRYAIERMSESKRRQVLLATRKPREML
jgi:3-methyladenine DNA glycosylase AlkD